MNCVACKLPINSFEIKYYDCTYDEMAQGAGTNCPRCSFVSECIRTGAVEVPISDILKVRVWQNYYCELPMRNGCISLDTFTQNVVKGRYPHIYRVRNHIPGATHSETTIATIQSWIKECTTTHRACQHVHRPAVYPKRLLDLYGSTVVLREEIQPARYACLSHCWGFNTDVARTTTDNLNDFTTNVPWDQLTTTFRNAITICRCLGILYLWIDSLCIIQDSSDDWKDQASKMADIYENSFITIAATKSKNGSGGCFAECEEKYLSKPVPGYQGIYVRQKPTSFPLNRGQLNSSTDWPLLNRAWIYQEMRLSQRVLHFCANEVIWRCHEVQRSESGSNDSDFGDSSKFCTMQQQSVTSTALQNDPRHLWYCTVQEYSRLQLTFQSDKMPALAGLTKRMQTMRPDDRYLAGLWEKTLLFDLLWFVWPSPVPGRQRTSTFPSWSWASVDCQVMWADCIDSTLDSVRVEEVRFVTIGPSHLGESSEATITIRAPLIDANLFTRGRSVAADPSHSDVIRVDQLYLYDYKVDCLPSGSPAERSGPDPSGFIVPIGVSTSDVFVAIHVQLRPGSECYERIGYVQISHPSMGRQLGDTYSRDYYEMEAQIRKDTLCVKELLDDLPTCTILLV
ncbi:heterokaryon incompatibility protein-domain-containing protein [Fusarium flagelliforme]|uniref:heterokaryon incompatibility protein-domain-containing protein n=1 Tax=Fusarium flagelliforme TaxID=2675880 RepID=UPI001E8EB0C7|nr:heterokaryon incompatibility protein-domain-containing protein [Fusarium flagelliforme]KAH7186196.1 heterokaryon incompatibility protein-domain-containing protein [Fusarium flagelliforme]